MSEKCDVCLWSADDIDNAFYAEREVRARKDYRCCECRLPIPAGTRYLRSVGRSEDDDDKRLWTYRTCLLCAEIRMVFYCHNGFTFTMLWEDMANQAFDRLTTASPCFTQLSPAAKMMVMDHWRRYKQLEVGAPGE